MGQKGEGGVCVVAGVDTGLMVHNTLTETMVPFVPANGRRVLWYTCGPTVYDACHMVWHPCQIFLYPPQPQGHARRSTALDVWPNYAR